VRKKEIILPVSPCLSLCMSVCVCVAGDCVVGVGSTHVWALYFTYFTYLAWQETVLLGWGLLMCFGRVALGRHYVCVCVHTRTRTHTHVVQARRSCTTLCVYSVHTHTLAHTHTHTHTNAQTHTRVMQVTDVIAGGLLGRYLIAPLR